MTVALPAIRVLRGKAQPPAARFVYYGLTKGQYLCPEHGRPMKPWFTTKNHRGQGNTARVKFECGCTIEGAVKMPGEGKR